MLNMSRPHIPTKRHAPNTCPCNGVRRAILVCILIVFTLGRFTPHSEETRILLYAPVNDGSLHLLNDFVSCMSHRRPGQMSRGQKADVVIITNGAQALDPMQRQHVKDAMSALKMILPRRSKIFSKHIVLAQNRYDRHQKSSKWVSGPNEAFYRTLFHGGDVFQAHIQPGRYHAVFQIELDVCPIRDGWLAEMFVELSATMTTSAVVSGGRLEMDVVCDSAQSDSGDACTTASEHPDYVREHINGNAMYRMGTGLQSLLTLAISLYPDWPFDLATYMAANATNQMQLLRYSPYIANRAVPIDETHALDPVLYKPSTYLVHITKAYKKASAFTAAAASLLPGLPITLIGACRHIDAQVLANLALSMKRQGVKNVIWAVENDSHLALDAVMHTRPLAIITSAEMQHSSTFGRCTPPLDVIDQLVKTRGQSIFFMEANAVVAGDLPNALASLEQQSVYFASASAHSDGYYFQGETKPRYHFTSMAFYVPEKVNWQILSNDWRQSMSQRPFQSPDVAINTAANCTRISACGWGGVPIRLLPTDRFISGRNVLGLWPSPRAILAGTVYYGMARRAESDTLARTDNLKGTRFMMQRVDQWLLPRDDECCSSLLVAEDVSITDDAASLHSYVNLLLLLDKTSTAKNIACAVPPFILDARTGRRISYDVLFDPTRVFADARVFPTVAYAPVCHFGRRTTMYSVPINDTASVGWQHWPLHAFSAELRRVVGLASRSTVLTKGSVCMDDTNRTLAEASLHLLRGSAAVVLSPPVNATVFLAGKWRVVDERVRNQMPNVLTLLSPALYPPHLPPHAVFASFGLRSHYPRLGEDVVLDVVDRFVCRLAHRIIPAPVSPMPIGEIYAGIFEFISPLVLYEELAITRNDDHDQFPPYLIPLESVENNGFFNTVNAAQVLGYMSNQTGFRATMPALSLEHLKHVQSPWSLAVADVTGFYNSMKSIRPSIWALFRHPTLLIEVMDGHMLPAGPKRQFAYKAKCVHESSHACIQRNDNWQRFASVLQAKRAFRRIHIVQNTLEAEEMRLMGYDVILGDEPSYLGMSDGQLGKFFNPLVNKGRDVVFRPFRAFNFQAREPKHVAYAKLWNKSFAMSDPVRKQASKVLDALAENFTCYHARVADEFTVQHLTARPHFQKKNVYAQLAEFVESRERIDGPTPPRPSVYLTTDVYDKAETIVGHSTNAAVTCHAFGCPSTRNLTWSLIEREVCASAHTFRGNIYSTFSLSVCARRNDHMCRDYFEQTLHDGRLLF